MTSQEGDEVAGKKYLYLTTIGRTTGKPHLVELWFAVAGGNIYLSHEGGDTDWMKNLRKHPEVTFTIGDQYFTGNARIIQEGDSFYQGKQALYVKYYGNAEKAVIDDWFSESSVIEISHVKTDTS